MALMVTGIDGAGKMELPRVYSKTTLPISQDNIVTEQDVKSWERLGHINVPTARAEEYICSSVKTAQMENYPWTWPRDERVSRKPSRRPSVGHSAAC